MTGAVEDNLMIVDQCIMPAEQEISIRQYNIARLETPLWKKAYGRLQVTNRRVLFRSAGMSLAGPVIIENEFSLEEIGGIEIKTDYRFDILTFTFNLLAIICLNGIYTFAFQKILLLCKESIVPAAVFSVLTILATFILLIFIKHKKLLKAAALLASFLSCSLLGITMRNNSFCWVLAAIFAIAFIIMCVFSAIVDDLHILIKIKGKGTKDVVEIGRKLTRDERSGFRIVRPWKDTEIAIRELGALIDDVKRFGNARLYKNS